VASELLRAWEPAPDLSLSEWASQYAMPPAETSAEPGKWRPHAFQIDIMDAIAGGSVERVTIMKSRRIGYTRILCHTIGYSIHADPAACSWCSRSRGRMVDRNSIPCSTS
jgi:phage terminase large subunit GpA-like protein